VRFVCNSPARSHVAEELGRPNVAKKDLPPLPVIRDDNIKLQIFTHRSFYAKQTRLFEDHPGRDRCHVNALTRASRLF